MATSIRSLRSANNAQQDRITTTEDNSSDDIQVINNGHQEQEDAEPEGEFNPSSDEIDEADLPATDDSEDEQQDAQGSPALAIRMAEVRPHQDQQLGAHQHRHQPTPRAEADQLLPEPSSGVSVPAESALEGLLQRLTESGGGSKGTDVSKPDKFSGEDRSKFRTFKTQCRIVFRANPHKFRTDERKVNFACSYLEGLAFTWYENILDLDDEPAWFNNWADFLQELEKQFGDVNVQAAAERKIRTLHMSTGAQVVDYITKFNTQANCLDWNDSAKASEFRRGLAPRIKDELARLPYGHELGWLGLQDACINIDNRHWEREAERTNDARSRPSAHTTAPVRPVINNFGYSPIVRPRNNNNFRTTRPISTPWRGSNSPAGRQHNSGRPLPLNSEGKVTEEEKQKRMRDGLCLYCGTAGHILNTCPKRPAPGTARMADATFEVESDF